MAPSPDRLSLVCSDQLSDPEVGATARGQSCWVGSVGSAHSAVIDSRGICQTVGVRTPRPDRKPTGEPDAGRAGQSTDDERPPRRVLLLAVIAATILILDVITKIIVVATLTPGVSPRILGGLVYFSLFRNGGAAFSMATGMTWILALIAIGVVVVIIRMAPRLRSKAWAVCLGLILGGALGNLSDRIFRAPGFLRGHVVDFVSLFGPDAEHFAVFNLADSAITIGGITLVVTTLFGVDFDGRRVARGGRGRAGATADPTRSVNPALAIGDAVDPGVPSAADDVAGVAPADVEAVGVEAVGVEAGGVDSVAVDPADADTTADPTGEFTDEGQDPGSMHSQDGSAGG